MADAGRVIAGRAKGIRLAAPGPTTRPLADRVKETLFAILEPDLVGAHVLDLFAGSGAGGIEALSRGAASAVFVERDAGAATVIAANLTRTHLAGPTARVVRREVIAYLHQPGAEGTSRFDVVLVDPPYDDPGTLLRVLERLGAPEESGARSLLGADARVVAKHFWRDRPPERVGLLASERERRFGETTLTFYRRTVDQEAGQGG